jgi:hypothetical protein
MYKIIKNKIKMKNFLITLLLLVPALLFSQTSEELDLVPFTRVYDTVYIKSDDGESRSSEGKFIFVFNYGEKTQMLQILPNGKRNMFQYLENPSKNNFDLIGDVSEVWVLDQLGGEWYLYLADDLDNGVVMIQGDFAIHFFNNVGQFD